MIEKVWLPTNQAWCVLWNSQILRIFNEEWEADAFIEDLQRKVVPHG